MVLVSPEFSFIAFILQRLGTSRVDNLSLQLESIKVINVNFCLYFIIIVVLSQLDFQQFLIC